MQCSIILKNTVELQWLEHLRNHVNMFEIGVVRTNYIMSVNHSAMPRYIFSIFFNVKVFCVFSLESPHWYQQYTNFNIKRKIDPNYLKSAAMGFFLGTQARVRNSHGKRAISVRAIEVLLYHNFCSNT